MPACVPSIFHLQTFFSRLFSRFILNNGIKSKSCTNDDPGYFLVSWLQRPKAEKTFRQIEYWKLIFIPINYLSFMRSIFKKFFHVEKGFRVPVYTSTNRKRKRKLFILYLHGDDIEACEIFNYTPYLFDWYPLYTAMITIYVSGPTLRRINSSGSSNLTFLSQFFKESILSADDFFIRYLEDQPPFVLVNGFLSRTFSLFHSIFRHFGELFMSLDDY